MHRSHYNDALCCGSGDGIDRHDRFGRGILIEDQQIALAPADFEMLSACHIRNCVCITACRVDDPARGDVAFWRMKDEPAVCLADFLNGGIE